MNEYILSGIIGAIIGYLMNMFIDFTKSIVKNYRTRKISDSLKMTNFKASNAYMPIDHAVPQYCEENICLKYINQSFIIPIPQNCRKELEDLGFEYHVETQYRTPELIEVFKNLGIDNYESVINESAQDVAEKFLLDLKSGYIRFNGYLFGIDSMRINRCGTEENAALSMDFYRTDYFTYRVFANIYQKYKDKFSLRSIRELNAIPHFLSSFGLGCYIIASDGQEDYMIIAHRGSNVIVDQNKLHFSMNEAFSMLDIDMFGNPSLVSCLYRGLKEELGSSEAYNPNILRYGFMDLSIDVDRLECGISCYTRLRFNNSFTIEQFSELYKSSKDKELETTELKFIPMKSLRSFIKENESSFSSGCLCGLYSLLTRYEAKQI